MFFFFQAEDGIRGCHVTGVQTCALPIFQDFSKKIERCWRSILKLFEESDQYGIWVTTQLVEASIDIDFDVLFTELSMIDSLLQRFGRCYRKRKLDHDMPNIYIYIQMTYQVEGVYMMKIY